MDQSRFSYYKTLGLKVVENLKRNGMQAFFCDSSDEAKRMVLDMIPEGATVGMAGSVTLKQVGITDELVRGKWTVYNQYLPQLTKAESLKIRKQGTLADYFLSGTNAVTLNGELVNLSGMGNKTAGLAYAKKVIIVAGVNKIVKDVHQGIKRARDLAAPMNAKRLNFNTPCRETGLCDYSACRPPDYHRMCNQLLIIEGETEKGRITVLLVGEELGF
jgi:L-lactate utilization protein LutB